MARVGRHPTPLDQKPRCSVEECEKFAVARGLCRNHYMRWYRRGGDPAEAVSRGKQITPVSQRGQHRVDEDTGCWEWLGHTQNGYGHVGVGSKIKMAHRAFYEELVGPIPEGMQLDHLCGNEGCVNPDHLDPCTSMENHYRGGRPHFELRGHEGGASNPPGPEPHQVTIGPKVHV